MCPACSGEAPRRERIISYVSGGVAAAVMVGLFAWFTGIDGVQDAGETAKVIEAQKQPVITHQPTHVEEPPKNLIAEDRSLEKTPREEKEIKISQKNIETVASTPPVETKTIVQAKEVEAVKQVEVKEYFDLPPVEVEGMPTDYLAEESKSGTEVGKITETNEDFIASSGMESDQISDTPPAEHYAMGDYVEPDRLWDQEGGAHSRNEGRFAAALRRGASRLLVPLDLLPVEKVATNDEKGIEIASMIRITKKIQND